MMRLVALGARCLGVLGLVSAVGCGGANSEPPASVSSVSPAESADGSEPAQTSSAAESAAAREAKPAEDTRAPLPTECSQSGASTCTPERAWVERLCRASFPSVALRLFVKGSPWTRGYLTRKTEAWNAAGGASEPSQLEFDEEVIVLVERTANPNGIQVSGAGGGYEALRWNGDCVTLAKEELTLKRPPKAKAAKVEWRFLDLRTRDTLSADPKVKQAYLDRRQECKGASTGTVSLKCVKADTKLSEAIVEFVRNGGELGEPEKLP